MVNFFGSQPSVWVWLAPVLTTSGTVLLFGGSLWGVWYTNRRTSTREIDKWHREILLGLCEEVTATQRDIDRRYNLEAIKTADNWDTYQDAVWMGTRKLGSLADSFVILGAHELSAKCQAIQKAAEAARRPALTLRTQVKTRPNEDVEKLPGRKNHLDALELVAIKRREFVDAAAQLTKSLMKPH